MPTRIFNFSAGPAVLPLPVLEEAQRDLCRCRASACRSWRSATARSRSRIILAAPMPTSATLAGIPANYKVLFLQGGASLQFSMVPMNLLGAGRDRRLHRHRRLGEKAIKEAKSVGAINVAAIHRRPTTSTASRAGRAEAHAGRRLRAHDVEQHDLRHAVAGRCRTSAARRSSPTRRPTSSPVRSTSKFGLIYAGAQKNLGPSGVTLVIVREDLLARSAATLPTMLSYKVQAENNSLYNTPPRFGIYILRLALKWLKSHRRPLGHRGDQRAQGASSTTRSIAPASTAATRAEGQPFADERHVPAADARNSRRRS